MDCHDDNDNGSVLLCVLLYIVLQWIAIMAMIMAHCSLVYYCVCYCSRFPHATLCIIMLVIAMHCHDRNEMAPCSLVYYCICIIVLVLLYLYYCISIIVFVIAVDCHDGDENGPMLYHALSSKIYFVDVVKAINEHAFKGSDSQ